MSLKDTMKVVLGTASEGRRENRTPLSTPVYLLRSGDSILPVLAMTENVSTLGARVVTNKPCDVGEYQRVSPFPGEYHLKARVVYCHEKPARQPGQTQYYVGLRLQNSFADWWAGVFGQRRAAPVFGKPTFETAINSA